jgi:hypothetical protein
VKYYYSKNAAETIISPTDIVVTHFTNIKAWGQHCNLDTNRGWIKLYYRNGDSPITYTLTNHKNLWYHDSNLNPYRDYHYGLQHTQPMVRRLTQAAQYELFHQRFGHPGERTMSVIHKHVDHVLPLKGNAFYKCASCTQAKLTCRTHETPVSTTPSMTSNEHPNPASTPTCGQHFAIFWFHERQ